MKENEICQYYVQRLNESCKNYRKQTIYDEYLEKSIYITFTKGCFVYKKEKCISIKRCIKKFIILSLQLLIIQSLVVLALPLSYDGRYSDYVHVLYIRLYNRLNASLRFPLMQ